MIDNGTDWQAHPSRRASLLVVGEGSAVYAATAPTAAASLTDDEIFTRAPRNVVITTRPPVAAPTKQMGERPKVARKSKKPRRSTPSNALTSGWDAVISAN
ncbi:MAG: hypothetical protein ABL908_11675 [Hyphomicrobium sp.]